MYQTYDLDSVQPSGDEPLGTKKKFWFVHGEFGRVLIQAGKSSDWRIGRRRWTLKSPFSSGSQLRVTSSRLGTARPESSHRVLCRTIAHYYWETIAVRPGPFPRLWIATYNSIGTLPPELRRRFTLGTYFFDLPDDDGWTGAGRLGLTLEQSAS